MTVVTGEAEAIRRIFLAYDSGQTPRDIAGALNRDGIAPPRGERWNASTINGDLARGNGILRNELYAGRIVWNKVRMVKDPDTGRRLSRANTADQHQAIDAPHLRIIDEELWARVQERRTARSRVPVAKRNAPKHLMSGLLRCGACGGGMSVHDRDHTGRVRVRCSTARESGSCDQGRRYYLDRIEAAVLDGFRERLREPDTIKAYVAEYNAERERLASTAIRNKARVQQRLAEAQRALKRAVENLIYGRISEADADQVLPDLRATVTQCDADLRAADEPPEIVALHPAALQRYFATVDRLAVVRGLCPSA